MASYKTISLLSILLLLTVFIPQSAEAVALFGNFDMPMEKNISFAAQFKDYIGKVINTVNDSLLLKAGFYLTLFIAIVKFGIGAQGLKDFWIYILVAILFAFPIYNGKSLLVIAADASDYLTHAIVEQIGSFDPSKAGGGVGALSALTSAEQETMNNYKYKIAVFNDECYQPAIKKADLPQGSNPKPSETSLDNTYAVTIINPLAMFRPLDPSTYTNPVTGVVNYGCLPYKYELMASLAATYKKKLRDYIDNLESQSPPIKLSDSAREMVNRVLNESDTKIASDLLNKGVAQSPGLKNIAGKEGIGKFDFLGLVLSDPRGKVIDLGLVFYWIFDYYIFHIVTVFKTIAAFGMILGFLYYIWMQKSELPLASLGLWVFSNGLYIVAAIGLALFNNMVLGTTSYLTAAVSALLGTRSNVNDALFALAVIGVATTPLAMFLSWKGLKMAISFMGSGNMAGSAINAAYGAAGTAAGRSAKAAAKAAGIGAGGLAGAAAASNVAQKGVGASQKLTEAGPHGNGLNQPQRKQMQQNTTSANTEKPAGTTPSYMSDIPTSTSDVKSFKRKAANSQTGDYLGDSKARGVAAGTIAAGTVAANSTVTENIGGENTPSPDKNVVNELGTATPKGTAETGKPLTSGNKNDKKKSDVTVDAGSKKAPADASLTGDKFHTTSSGKNPKGESQSKGGTWKHKKRSSSREQARSDGDGTVAPGSGTAPEGSRPDATLTGDGMINDRSEPAMRRTKSESESKQTYSIGDDAQTEDSKGTVYAADPIKGSDKLMNELPDSQMRGEQATTTSEPFFYETEASSADNQEESRWGKNSYSDKESVSYMRGSMGSMGNEYSQSEQSEDSHGLRGRREEGVVFRGKPVDIHKDGGIKFKPGYEGNNLKDASNRTI